ncbi:MAG: acryloyl-CoA reductase [Variibacter sp.]
MMHFNAFRVHTIAGQPHCRFEQLTLDDLDGGDVTIKVAYSSLNYKDAMAARGIGKNVRTDRPCVTGIDLSGTVTASVDPRFKPGDKVLVTNYKLGNTHDGGFSEYARVPGDWIVPLPAGMSLFDAMALGSAGLTAALAVDRLESAGLTPANGRVAVTGASGAVGSLCVNILAGRGYIVSAISGKAHQEPFLREIGAAEIVSRQSLMETKEPLGPMLWAAAIDNVGGHMLDRVTSRISEYGKVAVVGMAVGFELTTTVLPLVLRAVDLLGINVSRTLHMRERVRLWQRLATDFAPQKLHKLSRRVPFQKLNDSFDEFIEGTTVGHAVIEIGGDQ